MWWGLGLAAFGALAGTLVGGRLGGMVAAVTGAFAPTLFDRLKERVRLRSALAGVRRLPEIEGGTARLLLADRAVVNFVGRVGELAELIDWCEHDESGRVRLVTGPGGVGKSRLAVQLCERLRELGWRCELVGDQAEARALATVREVHRGRLLLVVDYAETRVGLAELLRQVAAEEAGGGLRVLLLARSAGDWWDRLGNAEPAVRTLLAKAYTGQDLSAAVTAEMSDRELVEAAAPQFAHALGVAAPRRVRMKPLVGPARILDLHAAALLAVLNAQNTGLDTRHAAVVDIDVDVVLADLLEHEEQYWQGSAQRAGLLDGPAGMTTRALRQIVAAGALLGAATQDESIQVLNRVPEAVATAKVARWLRDLYPPSPSTAEGADHEWLGTLRPDRLAEQHVVAELTASPDLADACLTRLTDRQALRALTLLGRASSDQPDAEPLLQRILPLLERVVDGLSPDTDLLAAIATAIPYPSLILANTAVVITRRILDNLPTSNAPLRALWLDSLGVSLAQIGDYTNALFASEGAMQIRRELAETNPDRYRSSLATSLTNLGTRFSKLGRLAEALTVTKEAVAIRRELVDTYPDRYRSSLATSLTNLGVQFSKLGQIAEALTVTKEAVAIRRELVDTYPDRYRSSLATSLNNLGIGFAELGQHGEALPMTEEAVAIRRELADTYPDRYRPDLADSLNNLGIQFSKLDRHAEALTVTKEAIAIKRELAETYPDRYRPDLMRSLWVLVHVLDALGRLEEAKQVGREIRANHPTGDNSDE